MKILIVSDDLFPGGAAQHAIDLSNALVQRGHSVTAATGRGEYRSRFVTGIHHCHLPLYTDQQRKSIHGTFASYRILRKLISHNAYDIVHTHKRITNALVRAMTLPGATRHITHFHNSFIDKRLFTFFGDYSICCSHAVRNVMIERFGCPVDRSATVHYGIDGFREYYLEEKHRIFDLLCIPRSKKVISSIGLFAPYKDRKNLVRAIALLSDTGFPRDFIFVIQGYGEEEREIQRMIAQWHLTDVVTIVKHDFKTEAIMNISEFMVLNSRDSEGFPFVILEAASIGKMHIGTTVGGIPEFIKDGETGILVPPGNPEALAVAIRSMIDNPQESIRLGKNAKQEYASRFTLDTMVDAIENVYRSVKQH
jgi:glycosyltransferase involved in cell wall biosynthesis